MPVPRIVGHRGAAGLAPENTLEAFRTAYALGVRLLELDVRLSRDGRPVCIHDDRLDRLTDARGPVADYDWEDLRRFRVMPGAFREAFPETRLALLGEVLEQMPADARFLVELKADPHRPAELVRSVIETLEAAECADRCRLISFEQDLLRRLWALGAGRWALGVIRGAREGGTLIGSAREVGAVAVHAQVGSLDEDMVRRAREEGFLVSAWTVNHAGEVRRLGLLGVDEIATDYPDMAISTLAEGTA